MIFYQNSMYCSIWIWILIITPQSFSAYTRRERAGNVLLVPRGVSLPEAIHCLCAHNTFFKWFQSMMVFGMNEFLGGSDFGLYDGSDLWTSLLLGWWGLDALAVCRAHRGLPVGLFLLRCSVLFAVWSLSLLHLLVVSWFVYSGGRKGSFKQTK